MPIYAIHVPVEIGRELCFVRGSGTVLVEMLRVVIVKSVAGGWMGPKGYMYDGIHRKNGI